MPAERSGFRLDVIALEHRPLVADLAGDESAGERQRERGGIGQAELRAAKRHVLRVHARRDAVEVAAHGEIRDGHGGFAERLHGLGRDLNIAEQIHLIDFADAGFLNDLVLLLHLKNLAGFADAEALGIEVERAEVVARRHEAADRGL